LPDRWFDIVRNNRLKLRVAKFDTGFEEAKIENRKFRSWEGQMSVKLNQSSPRRSLLWSLLALGVAALIDPHVYADQIPGGWEGSNMTPIGYSDLGGKEAFKMAIKHVGDRWYLYLGHFTAHGWSIIDVTDPKNPQVVKFIPGPEKTSAGQIDLHDNIMITPLQDRAGYGGDPNKQVNEGLLVWDIHDPVNPKQLSWWKTGATGTHRDSYPGGKYVNMSAGMPGYKGQILVFLDISEPNQPKEAGRWWLPGQKEGEPPLPAPIYGFHGPAVIEGDRAYLGYSPAVVILDITDISKPKLIGQLTVNPPFGTNIPVHDVMPIPGRDLLFAHAEGTGGGDTPEGTLACKGALFLTGLIDIKDPTKPKLISTFPTPAPPKDAPYTDFCDKGGRFGPHNTNILQHNPDVEKQGDLIYLTYFNAGLRVFNIKDSRLPTETGWFIPPTPTVRRMPAPHDKLVSQTEDVLVDTRGNIYITNKQWGLFILRYTGPGEPAPTAK
jgi:hypothetical protein